MASALVSVCIAPPPVALTGGQEERLVAHVVAAAAADVVAMAEGLRDHALRHVKTTLRVSRSTTVQPPVLRSGSIVSLTLSDV
jgi:hypothetical protein